MHTRNVNNTLTNINEMLNQPEQKIRRSNNRILLMFLVGTAVFALIAVALIYLAIVLILTKIVGVIERRLRKSDRR